MGNLTVSDIFIRVQRQFGDETSAQVTVDDVTRWVNDAMREIAIKNDLLQVKGSQDATASTIAYTLPVDIAKLQSVKYKGISLRSSSLQQIDEMIQSKDLTVVQGYPLGTPEYYWIYANQINLYPAPDSSLAGAMTIYYTRHPVPVTQSDDTPELSAEYDNRIVEYCLAQAFELDANFDVASIKMGSFRQGVADLKGEKDWTPQEFYPFITDSGDGGWSDAFA